MKQEERKPTYEELEVENKQLKRKFEQVHFNIGAYMKKLHQLQLEFMVGTKSAYKVGEYFLMPDLENENFKYIKSHHMR